eukprot:scaffold33044_cov36-Prasinocladus_malaysianus.AAC.3
MALGCYGLRLLPAVMRSYRIDFGLLSRFQVACEVFSTSGRRKPPPGRWIASGTEALKSGLNVGDAALSYDEGGNLKEARWAGRAESQPPPQ